MAKINLIFPDGTEARYALEGDAFTIGRAEDNDLVLPDQRVSSHHAVLKKVQSGDFVLNDLGATNPTRVNGRPTQLHELRHGDTILWGDIYAAYENPTAGGPLDPRAPRRPGAPSAPVAEAPAASGCFALALALGVAAAGAVGLAVRWIG